MSTSIAQPKWSCVCVFFFDFLGTSVSCCKLLCSCSPLRFASLRHTDMSERPRPPGCVKRIVRHAGFDFFFAFVVLTNSIFIGVEVQLGLENQGARPLAIYIFQYAYTFLFSLELAMRLWADCRYFLCSEEWMCLGPGIKLPSSWWNMGGITRVICCNKAQVLKQGRTSYRKVGLKIVCNRYSSYMGNYMSQYLVRQPIFHTQMNEWMTCI